MIPLATAAFSTEATRELFVGIADKMAAGPLWKVNDTHHAVGIPWALARAGE